MAGYVGFAPNWVLFEQSAKTVYDNHGIDVFHAKQFHDTKCQFKGWRQIRKQTYAKEIYGAAVNARAIDIGIAFSTRKDAYKKRKLETGLNINFSAYGFCFTVILHKLLEDPVFKEIIGRNGVDITVVVEAGNKNDYDLRQIFNCIRAQYRLESKLNSIAFQPKESSRALQLADFFAFNVRRHTEAIERGVGKSPEENFYLQVMKENIHVISEVATDFHAEKPS